MLSLVKALRLDQHMNLFVVGRVSDVVDEDYAALEEQVESATKAIMDRLDF